MENSTYKLNQLFKNLVDEAKKLNYTKGKKFKLAVVAEDSIFEKCYTICKIFYDQHKPEKTLVNDNIEECNTNEMNQNKNKKKREPIRNDNIAECNEPKQKKKKLSRPNPNDKDWENLENNLHWITDSLSESESEIDICTRTLINILKKEKNPLNWYSYNKWSFMEELFVSAWKNLIIKDTHTKLQYSPTTIQKSDIIKVDRIIPRINTMITSCYNLYKNGIVYAPYFPIIQSTGTGKTTLMHLIQSLGYKNTYMKLSNIENLLERNTFNYKNHYDNFLYHIKIACIEENEDEAQKKMKNAINILTNRATVTKSKELRKIRSNNTETSSNNTLDCNPYALKIILIDEAKSLCSIEAFYKRNQEKKRTCFELLRKVLSTMNDTVMIFADTVSSVANFTPTVERYPAHMREKDIKGVKLFPPFYNIGFMDLYEDQYDRKNKMVDNMVCFGRPMWYNEYQNKQSEPTFIQFVTYKINGRLNDDHEKHFAILASRISMNIINPVLTKSLIANSLAICTYISDDRNIIRCKYMSEPIVSELCAHITKKNKYITNYTLWNCLHDSLKKNHIDRGNSGEIIAQKILLDVFDSYSRDFGKNTDISLNQFISTFIPKETSTSLEQPNDLNKIPEQYTKSITIYEDTEKEEYCIFFNHFFQLEKGQHITVGILDNALKRSAGLQLKENAKGADLVIPIYGSISKKLVGALFIQVRNKKDEKTSKINFSLNTGLQPSYIFTKENIITYRERKLIFFGIHLNLSSKGKKPRLVTKQYSKIPKVTKFNKNSILNIVQEEIKQFKEVSNAKVNMHINKEILALHNLLKEIEKTDITSLLDKTNLSKKTLSNLYNKIVPESYEGKVKTFRVKADIVEHLNSYLFPPPEIEDESRNILLYLDNILENKLISTYDTDIINIIRSINAELSTEIKDPYSRDERIQYFEDMDKEQISLLRSS